MNEQFVEALKVFGTIILNGAGSPEEATKGLNFVNGLLAEHPNIFPIIQDPNNRAIFEQCKETISTINFDTIGIMDAPKFMQLIPLAKKINLYN